jgi:hypothetical protein
MPAEIIVVFLFVETVSKILEKHVMMAIQSMMIIVQTTAHSQLAVTVLSNRVRSVMMHHLIAIPMLMLVDLPVAIQSVETLYKTWVRDVMMEIRVTTIVVLQTVPFPLVEMGRYNLVRSVMMETDLIMMIAPIAVQNLHVEMELSRKVRHVMMERIDRNLVVVLTPVLSLLVETAQ